MADKALGFLANLFKSKKTKQIKEIRMCVLGLDNAGKTTILYKLKLGEIQIILPRTFSIIVPMAVSPLVRREPVSRHALTLCVFSLRPSMKILRRNFC